VNSKNSQYNWKQVIKFAGAIIAYLIGAGFASGQETMQYFTSFGVKGALGAALLTLILYVWFSSTIMQDGHKLKLSSSNKIFEYYCGKYLGRFYEIYTPIFLFLVFMVMISGAGAILTEFYDFNPQVGRIIMALLALFTVLSGLTQLVNIVSKIGPVIILFAILIGIANVILNPSGISQADHVMKTIDVTKAAPTWYVSGIIFPSMGCIMIAPFLSRLGVMANSKKEAQAGGILGGLAFSLAVVILSFGIMASISELYMKNIPTLFLTQQMFPGIGFIFSLVLFAGIYTTAVPMLWLSSNAVFTDEKSKKYIILVFVLTTIAFIGGQLPFAKLVNVLYPISGYLGILLFACILIKQFKGFLKTRSYNLPGSTTLSKSLSRIARSSDQSQTDR